MDDGMNADEKSLSRRNSSIKENEDNQTPVSFNVQITPAEDDAENEKNQDGKEPSGSVIHDMVEENKEPEAMEEEGVDEIAKTSLDDPLQDDEDDVVQVVSRREPVSTEEVADTRRNEPLPGLHQYTRARVIAHRPDKKRPVRHGRRRVPRRRDSFDNDKILVTEHNELRHAAFRQYFSGNMRERIHSHASDLPREPTLRREVKTARLLLAQHRDPHALTREALIREAQWDAQAATRAAREAHERHIYKGYKFHEQRRYVKPYLRRGQRTGLSPFLMNKYDVKEAPPMPPVPRSTHLPAVQDAIGARRDRGFTLGQGSFSARQHRKMARLRGWGPLRMESGLNPKIKKKEDGWNNRCHIEHSETVGKRIITLRKRKHRKN